MGKIETINNIERSRLTYKEAKELRLKFKGVIDKISTSNYDNDVYLLNDGSVIVMYETFAYQYKSLNVLKSFYDSLKLMQENRPVSHILEGKLLYGSQFGSNAKRLAGEIERELNLNENLHLENLKIIDDRINKKGKTQNIDSFFFSRLVAYVGQEMMFYLNGGSWVTKKAEYFDNVWEPFISFNDRIYNPYLPIYRELFEELPETGKVDIFDSVTLELNKK